METLGRIFALIVGFALIGAFVAFGFLGLSVNQRMWKKQLQKKIGDVPEYVYIPREVQMGCAPLGVWFIGGILLGIAIAIGGGFMKNTTIAAIGGIVSFLAFLPAGLMWWAYESSETKSPEPELESSLTDDQRQLLNSTRKEKISKLRSVLLETDQSERNYEHLLGWKIQFQLDQYRSEATSKPDSSMINLDELHQDFETLIELGSKEFPPHMLKSWRKILK